MTHIWFSRKLLGYSDNMTVLGAIFPDIVITGCLTYDQTHQHGWGLYDYFYENHKQAMPFADSLVTHTVNPRGLDYYGDMSYKEGGRGYCFMKAAPIVREVVDACNIPQDMGLWKAHNFIEMGIEMNMISQDRQLVQQLYDAFGDIPLIRELSGTVENYYGLGKSNILECFKRFTSYVELEDISFQNLAAKYDLQMQARHGIRIDKGRSAEIIEECSRLVTADFDIFIAECESKVKEMLGCKQNEQRSICDWT